MSLVIVSFCNTGYYSVVIDGRLPYQETGKSCMYWIPTDQVKAFVAEAKKHPYFSSCAHYRHVRTYK